MPKPNRMMDPVEVSLADLVKMGDCHPDLKKYVDAVKPMLDCTVPSCVAGHIEVRNENGLPVLRFTPRRVPLADLIKNKL